MAMLISCVYGATVITFNDVPWKYGPGFWMSRWLAGECVGLALTLLFSSRMRHWHIHLLTTSTHAVANFKN